MDIKLTSIVIIVIQAIAEYSSILSISPCNHLMVLALPYINHIYCVHSSVVVEHFTDYWHHSSFILFVN